MRLDTPFVYSFESRAYALAGLLSWLCILAGAALLGPVDASAQKQATVRFALPEAAHIRLSVYDVTGRRVATLLDARQPAGRTERTLRLSALPAGPYLLRLTAGTHAATKTLNVVR